MALTRLKVCCISSPEEAAMAVALGASALGLVSAMPSGPGVVAEEAIARIARSVPPGVATFLLTSLCEAEAIIDQQRRCGTNVLQLCDALADAPRAYAELRRALPGIGLVQVIHVRGWDSVIEAKALAPHVDALLLDSGRPDLPVKELGGTGRVHDWQVSRRIVEEAGVPVWLAGGLRPDTAWQAIGRVGPFGLDICSGVRTAGSLDRAKLIALAQALQAAAGTLG